MNIVTEPFVIKKNNFSRAIYAGLTLLALTALIVSWNKEHTNKLALAAGLLLFGTGWWMALKTRIVVMAEGFEFTDIRKRRFIKWEEVTALQYDMMIHGRGAQPRLDIHYPGGMIPLFVKRYQRKPIERFIELLHQQCTHAQMNDHFINLATGQMTFRNKLKML